MAPIACVLFSAAANAEPAWHDQYQGNDVLVHYVRLTGYIFDQKAQRRLLEESYTGCVEDHQRTNRPYAPLPPEGLPEIPYPQELEIYYSVNLAVSISRSKNYFIDSADCSLKTTPHKFMSLPVGMGKCSIDLLEKTATGICKEPQKTGDQSASKFLGNFNVVPPVRRAEVLATLEKIASRPHAPSSEQPTGEKRHIAGYQCDVYGTGGLAERCIAKPGTDFTFPIAFQNAYVPGLLLQLRSEGSTLTAQEVKLHIRVSKKVFEMPEGITAASSSKGKR
jgi:hypothetical protein